MQSCDTRGGVLPFPYGTGACYLFSAALLRFIASSPGVTRWVADAAGPSREELQWQKFEDTSTGYWLSYCPHTIQFIDIGPQVRPAGSKTMERRGRGAGNGWRRVH